METVDKFCFFCGKNLVKNQKCSCGQTISRKESLKIAQEILERERYQDVRNLLEDDSQELIKAIKDLQERVSNLESGFTKNNLLKEHIRKEEGLKHEHVEKRNSRRPENISRES